MYFSTVLVFLFTFKFIQPEDELVPFSYEHTEETDQFLETVTKDIEIYQSSRLDLCVNDFSKIDLGTGNDDPCGSLNLNQEKNDFCSYWCTNTNIKYVYFLNNNIEKIRDNLFSDAETNILTLDATYINPGECVPKEKKKPCRCLCKGDYEIMVSRTFYNSFLNIINQSLMLSQTERQKKDVVVREEFSALAILLKFYPHCALFYLAYLVHKYETHPNQYKFTPNNLMAVALHADGNGTKKVTTDDKSAIAKSETDIKIFMKMYKFIVSDSGDFDVINNMYYEQFNNKSISTCLLPIVQYLLWDPHNYLDSFSYSKHNFST